MHIDDMEFASLYFAALELHISVGDKKPSLCLLYGGILANVATCRYPDGTIVEQLYSVPLNLELAASNCPTQVTQCSFEETGFLQHQPTESVMPFEEWRRSRFGNMRPTVILDTVGEALECSPPEEKARGIETPCLIDCLNKVPGDDSQPEVPPRRMNP
ncbi:hypothetical protein, conserved [Eimeria acervulina]|uniref:Uncharacterized protein n=1 Tax=Eimeria acervulina TaxID=5801 RepID=U6GNN7_EIMAC|nr:hypothetical protein, conserved [Eimeria acervulina]CDI80893.1 hypothetical protein, conserved [Eimeria acervulina]